MLSKLFGKNTITYIANAGVMLSFGGTKVIVDGVIENVKDKYIAPQKDYAESLILAKEPYHNIDYIFITHKHKDHVDLYMVNEVLKRNKHIRLICPKETGILLTKQRNYNKMLSSQIFNISLKNYSSIPISFENFNFTAYRIPHDGVNDSVTEHLVYCMEFEGKSVIVLGDASQVEYDYEMIGLPEKADVVICAANMAGQRSGRNVLKKLKPKQVFLCHMKGDLNEIKRIDDLCDKYRKDLPKMTLLTQAGEKVKI